MPYKIGDTCPACGQKIEREENAADFRCVNPNCPAQLESHIINFAGRTAMDIKGLGETAIHNLIEKGYLKGVVDIYKLKEHSRELIDNKILGKEKNTNKVLAAIEDSKSNDPAKLLTGIGIFGIGAAAARDLIKTFGSIERIASASEEELIAVPDLGEISVRHIRNYFNNEANINLLNELKNLGLNLGSVENRQQSTTQIDENFSGKKFVLTGTLENFTRSEAQELIEARGGKVSNSVSKNTDYVVAGENAGSKLQKAIELKIKILSESDFDSLISIVHKPR